GDAPMTDEELQARIDEALDVAPAPDFRARVHARIAQEPETPRWWMPRAALRGCLAGTAFALSVWIMPSPAPSDPPASSAPVPRDASSSAMGRTAAAVPQSAAGARASITTVPDATTSAAPATMPTASSSSSRLSFEPAGTVRRIALPEVIVPADQQAAVAR